MSVELVIESMEGSNEKCRPLSEEGAELEMMIFVNGPNLDLQTLLLKTETSMSRVIERQGRSFLALCMKIINLKDFTSQKSSAVR